MSTNPYVSTTIEIRQHQWSGFPQWIKRLYKIIKPVIITLLILDIPILGWYMSSNAFKLHVEELLQWLTG
jgi:hypothetical protein